MDSLIRVSTALGRVAAICNHRNPHTPSELLTDFPQAPSDTLVKLMQYYHSVPFDDDLEACREAVLAEIGAEPGAEIPPDIPESLDVKAFWEGFHSERRNLRGIENDE